MYSNPIRHFSFSHSKTLRMTPIHWDDHQNYYYFCLNRWTTNLERKQTIRYFCFGNFAAWKCNYTFPFGFTSYSLQQILLIFGLNQQHILKHLYHCDACPWLRAQVINDNAAKNDKEFWKSNRNRGDGVTVLTIKSAKNPQSMLDVSGTWRNAMQNDSLAISVYRLWVHETWTHDCGMVRKHHSREPCKKTKIRQLCSSEIRLCDMVSELTGWVRIQGPQLYQSMKQRSWPKIESMFALTAIASMGACRNKLERFSAGHEIVKLVNFSTNAKLLSQTFK